MLAVKLSQVFLWAAALLEHNFVTPRARPSNSTSTPRRGDVFLFLRKFYALVVVYKVLFFLFAGLIYYLLQGKLLLIFPFCLVDIPEQRRAGNHAYILEFRPCLFGLVGIYYRLRGAVCFMFSFSHFFYSLSRIVWTHLIFWPGIIVWRTCRDLSRWCTDSRFSILVSETELCSVFMGPCQGI